VLLDASDPAGARVELDGTTLPETTPTAVRGLAPGKHQLRILGEHRTPVEETVVFTDGQRSLVEATLPPASHFVEIQTRPADATIYLENRLIMQHTPVRVQLSDDDFYQLRIEKAGYEPLETRITPDQRGPALSFTLEPERESRGSIIVDSTATARVFVDGNDTGLSTPTRAISLPIGNHSVQARSPDGDSATQRVAIKAGDTVHLSLNPASERKRR
jgi:hypothetical protein